MKCESYLFRLYLTIMNAVMIAFGNMYIALVALGSLVNASDLIHSVGA